MGYTAMRAALAAILVCIGLSFLRKETRFTWKTFFDAMIVCAKRGVMIAGATAAAGIVIGVISLTGVGITFSSLVMSLSYGIMAFGLILIMIACIIMGMGTPTTVAYIIVVTLAAPAMMEFGFSQLASHMFVFYFGVMSMITPPVEVAAYAAADISKADPITIGFTACRIAILAFVMPYAFLFEPALLMQGSWWKIISTFVMTLIAVIILAGAITGWFFYKLNLIWRFIFSVIFILIIIPEFITSIIGVSLALSVAFGFYISSKAKEKKAGGKQLNLGWK
jgi:TRAP-type uncharacterized transport system fused permease subunit